MVVVRVGVTILVVCSRSGMRSSSNNKTNSSRGCKSSSGSIRVVVEIGVVVIII